MAKFAEGGKRKGAGRKGYEHELMVKKVLKSATNIIFNTLEGKGKWADISLELKLDIAKAIYVKAMPQKIDGEMDHKHTVMGRVKINGQPLELEIG